MRITAKGELLIGGTQVGASSSTYPTKVGIQKFIGANATTIISNAYYLGIGGNEYTVNSYRLIGLGYTDSTATTYPAYIGYQEKSVTGFTYGDIIFGTRTATGATDDPIERMRITSIGEILIGSISNQHSAKLNVAGKLFLPYTSNSDIGGAFYSYNDISYQLYAGGLKFQIFNNDGTSYGLRDAVTITGGGNLGVGTISPAGRLTVAGPNGAGISIDQGNYNYYGAYNHIFKSSSYMTEYMRIDNNGFIGVGVESPMAQFSMNNQIPYGSTPPTSYAATNGVNGQNFLNGYYAYNTDGYGAYPRYLDIVSVGSPDGSNGGSNIRFFTNPKALSSPAVERLRITSGGSVNINNTTNTTYKFSTYNNVEDTHVLIAGLAPSLRFADTVTGITYSSLFGMATIANNFITGSSAGDFAITWGSTKKCYFGYTNATAIMVLDGGNLGLGTLTVGSKAQINGNMAVGYSASTAAPTNGILSNGGFKSSAPASASAGTWKLGTATSTSPMVQNRYITVEIDGSVYALFAQFLY